MLVCFFCKATVYDRDEAIAKGWEPDFYDGDV